MYTLARSAPATLSRVAIRRGSRIGGCRSASPRALVAAVSVWRGRVTGVLPWVSVHGHVGAPRAAKVVVDWVFGISPGNDVDQLRDLLLDNADSSLYNLIGIQDTDALHFEVEAIGHRIVVKGFAFLRGLLPFCVLALGPGNLLMPAFFDHEFPSESDTYIAQLTIPSQHLVQPKDLGDVACCADHTRSLQQP